MIAPPDVRGAIVTYTGPDGGSWNTPANWSTAAVPATIDDVVLGSHSGGAADLNVNFNQTASVPFTSVTLNSTAINGFMIVNQTNAGTQLSTVTLNIGTTVIDNTWNQGAGTVSASTLNIGVNATSSAGNSYNLFGSGVLSGDMNVGVSGFGLFNQAGGQHNVNGGTSTLGVNAGSSGTYKLSAGTLAAGSAGIQVGKNGTGLFTQTGGTSAIGFLDVGRFLGDGTFNMSGGTLAVGLGGIVLGGGGGTGTFNLSGGVATVVFTNGTAKVSVNSGGTFNVLTAGTLDANIDVNSGGIFNLQTGGKITATPANLTTALLTVNTGGVFNLQGGTFLVAPTLVLPGGIFRLLGHSLTAKSLGGDYGILESAGGNAVLTLTLASGSADYGGTLRDGTSSVLSLVLNGSSFQQTMSGDSSYTGSTTITSGSLVAGSNTGFSQVSDYVVNGGALSAGGFSVTIGSLAGSGGVVDVGSGSLFEGGYVASGSYGGVLTGTGILGKAGNGNLTLTGGGSFSGDILVSNGSVTAGAVNGIATGANVRLTSIFSVLNLNASQVLAGLQGINSSKVNFTANSTLTLGGGNADSTFSGDFTGGGTVVKTGTGIFTIGTGAGDTASANTDTSLAFTVNAGTLALSKADGTTAVAGALTVNGGTVLVQRSNQIADTSPLTVNGGTFNLGSFTETVGNLSGTGGSVLLGAGSAITVTQTASAGFAGTVTGSGAFIKSGPADLTLPGTGSFGGTYTANSGKLILQGAVNGTGFAALAGGTVQFNNSTTNANGVTVQAFLGGSIDYLGATMSNTYLRGPGTHTVLSGGAASTFNGVTTYNSTVLILNGSASFNNFTNGGTLSNNASATFNGGTNTSSGVVNVAGTLNTKDFSSDGVINVGASGTVGNSVANFVLGGGSRTYIGTVAAPGGTLATASGTSIELNGGLLVNNGTQTGTLNVNFGGVAKGAGTFGVVNVTDGGRFSPGNSPGTATVSQLTLSGGGSYQFELNSANATPGNGIDFINDLGLLTIAAGTTPNSVFTIALVTLDGANQPSALSDFDSSLPYGFTLATTATGISGFAANEFAVDASGFANNLRGGTFSVAQQGNSLMLNFTPVPEPTTAVLLCGGLGLLSVCRTRRARKYAGTFGNIG
ncbi:MAG: PEP-CTERM sorting domain-containing protein [Chthoniobacteraceae bacterium]